MPASQCTKRHGMRRLAPPLGPTPARRRSLAAGVVCLGVVSTAVWAAETARIEVSADGARVSLEVAGVPLGAVLERLAIEAGFALTMRGSLDEPVTLRLQDEPIERALARLLDGQPYAMRHDSTGAADLARAPAWLVVVDRPDGEPTVPRADADPAQASPQRLTPDDQEQLRTIRALRRGDPVEAVRPLSALLRTAANPRVRQSALAALAEIDAATALRAVRSALGDGDPAVRQQALRQLVEFDPGAAARKLAEILQGHVDPATRAFAADALAGDTSADARTALWAAARDPHPLVRAAAEQALGASPKAPE